MTDVRWPEVLTALLRGQDLDEATAHSVMRELMSGDAESSHVAALLIALRAKGESGSEIAGFVRGTLEAAEPIELDPAITARLVDTCGTGGDGAGTFNISTVAALVVAAAGVPVAKHGNRAASGTCGSADLLEAWGVAIDLGPEQVAACLTELGIGFLYARLFHPAMRHVAPVRVQLGIRTVFNLLGPLSNPAGAPHQVVGIADPSLGEPMATALAQLGKRRALVFHGRDGLDELTLSGPSDVWEVRGGEVISGVVDPGELGLQRATVDQLRGGTVSENVAIADAVLAGGRGPHRDVVVLNAAAALMVAGAADELTAGIRLAGEAIDDGWALALRDRWAQRSTELAERVDG